MKDYSVKLRAVLDEKSATSIQKDLENILKNKDVEIKFSAKGLESVSQSLTKIQSSLQKIAGYKTELKLDFNNAGLSSASKTLENMSQYLGTGRLPKSLKQLQEDLNITAQEARLIGAAAKEAGIELDKLATASASTKTTGDLDGSQTKTFNFDMANGEKFTTSLKSVNGELEKVKYNSNEASKAFNSLQSASKAAGLSEKEFGELMKSRTSITKQAINTTETYQTANGKIIEITKIAKNGQEAYTMSVKEAGSASSKTAKQMEAVGKSLDGTTKKLVGANFATDNWAYSWTKAMQSFLTYNTVTQVFNNIVNGVREMISEVMELDSALVELQKVTDLEGESLDRFTKRAYDAGAEVAKTGTEMVEASTEFAKAGYKDEDQILYLGKIANMYTNIADEEISAADAADFIIGQMKAFNIEAEDSQHIIDAVNEVSNNFAVSSADIATNLGKSSAVMANAGNSMEQMIGLNIRSNKTTLIDGEVFRDNINQLMTVMYVRA